MSKIGFVCDLLLSIITYTLLAFVVPIFWTFRQFVTTLGRILKSRNFVVLKGCDSVASLERINQQSNEDGHMKYNIGLELRLKKRKHLNISWLQTKFETIFVSRNASETNVFANLYTYLIQFGGYTYQHSVDAINLELQIQEATVPSSLSLQEYYPHFFAANYENGTPFWKVLLIPAPDADDEVLVVFKIHHALADGYTLLHILDLLTESKTPYIVKEFQESFWDKVVLKIRTPRLLWSFVRDSSREPSMFFVDEGEGQFFSFSTLNLTDLKRIRRITGSKFDSVFISLLGGVIRRIFLEGSTEDKLPKYIYISSSVPWPNHPCWKATECQRKMCNHWSLASVKVPMLKDSLKRLREVDLNFKNHLEQGYNKIIWRFNYPLFGTLPDCIKRIWANNLPFQFTCSINMGSAQAYFLDQNEVKSVREIIGCTLPKAAIMGTCFSNSDRFECTLAIRKSIAGTQENSDIICRDYLNEELQGLLQHLRTGVEPGAN